MQTLQLPISSLSTISGAAQISCDSGLIWLTDDGHDVVLKSGQTWRIRGHLPVVVEALLNSRMQLHSEPSLIKQLQQLAIHRFGKLASTNRRSHHIKTA